MSQIRDTQRRGLRTGVIRGADQTTDYEHHHGGSMVVTYHGECLDSLCGCSQGAIFDATNTQLYSIQCSREATLSASCDHRDNVVLRSRAAILAYPVRSFRRGQGLRAPLFDVTAQRDVGKEPDDAPDSASLSSLPCEVRPSCACLVQRSSG